MHRRIVVIISATMFLSIFAGCRLTSRTAFEIGTQPKEETASEKEPAADTAIKDEESGIEIDLDEIANRLMYSKTDVEWKLPMSGCILTLPESFRSLKGQVYAYDTGETDTGSDVFHCRLFYAAASDADREALSEAFISYMTESKSEEESLADVAQASEKYAGKGVMPFLDILVFSGKYSLDEAKADAQISEDLVGKEIDLGEHGDYRYYCLTRDYALMEEQIRDSFTDEYYDEFMTLVENAKQLEGNILCTEPAPMTQEVSEGTEISFETTDLDGNPVKSEDLFADHKITMINIWATWCDPCKEELPYLEKLNKELAGKECKIIGICDDTADDPDAVREAKKILQDIGVTFVNLVQTEEIQELLPIPGYPVSYFVGSEGRVVSSPVVGADETEYAHIIEKAVKDAE